MNLWLNNPVANLDGPGFLLFYAVMALVVGWLSRCAVSRLTQASEQPSTVPGPLDPDPYVLAYLNEGKDEVVRVALLSLIQKGRLEVITESGWLSKQFHLVFPPNPGSDPLNHLENSVLSAIATAGQEARVNLRKARLLEAVESFCMKCQVDLEERGLLQAERIIARCWLWLLGAVVFLGGLALYKVWVASARGHSNIGFLIMMALAAPAVLLAACKPSRLTAAGAAHLEALKNRLGPTGVAMLDSPLGSTAVLVMVSLFGLPALQDAAGYGTVYSFFEQEQLLTGSVTCGSGASGGGCGGGCGGGGCGGCGGCG